MHKEKYFVCRRKYHKAIHVRQDGSFKGEPQGNIEIYYVPDNHRLSLYEMHKDDEWLDARPTLVAAKRYSPGVGRWIKTEREKFNVKK